MRRSSVSAACSVATAPILWLQFGAVPLLGILANALVEPAVGPLLGLAFAAAAVDPVAPQLAAGLAWLNGWVAAYIALCARLVAALPVAQARGPGAALAGRGVARRRRLCLAGMADELKPAYLIAGTDRPKVDRTRRAAAQPLRRRRGRGAPGRRDDRARTRSPPAT